MILCYIIKTFSNKISQPYKAVKIKKASTIKKITALTKSLHTNPIIKLYVTLHYYHKRCEYYTVFLIVKMKTL